MSKRYYYGGIILVLVLLVAGRNYPLKRSVRKYQGDGDIRYLPPPGLLGVSGCEIRFPATNFSGGFVAEYDMMGIPEGKYYTPYLVVPDAMFREEMLQGRCSFLVKKNGQKIFGSSSRIGDMTNFRKGSDGLNRFYHFVFEDQEDFRFDVKGRKSSWSLRVECETAITNEQIDVFVIVARGGKK